MFIENLKIISINGVLRNIHFTPGLNLVIDNTPFDEEKSTGNNVGKTTVLKLIDFCLGADKEIIYTDSETKRQKYKEVQEFLENYEVEIILTLIDDFDSKNPHRLVIKRNFMTRNKSIREIDGKQIKDKDFEKTLLNNLFPSCDVDKPTFRQLIAHNIRYKDNSINNTLKMLDSYTTDTEYETLFLYMLGCKFDEGAYKQAIFTKIKQEENFKEKLESKQTKTAYEISLQMLDNEIEKLNKEKQNLNINPNLENDINQLNSVKLEINKNSSNISKMLIRKNIIEESRKEIELNSFDLDKIKLEELYKEIIGQVGSVQKTFENLVDYHNSMLLEKQKFITSELPQIEKNISISEKRLNELCLMEKTLVEKITKSDTFEDLENIISKLNEQFRIKGEYESVISQLSDSETGIESLKNEIEKLDDKLYSQEFENCLKAKIHIFNEIFSSISEELYGEKYLLKYDIVTNRKGRKNYIFDAFNANFSSGKKQGEILCFDLAYLIFSSNEKMDGLKFLLNDKKELMHDNQLIKMANFVKNKNIQLIISILKDKLPDEVISEANIAVELSPNEKLFKIEQQDNIM